jgi:hypothetical protein
MAASDTPSGVAFSLIERQLCLQKVTANIIRLNCRFEFEKKKLNDQDVAAGFGVELARLVVDT